MIEENRGEKFLGQGSRSEETINNETFWNRLIQNPQSKIITNIDLCLVLRSVFAWKLCCWNPICSLAANMLYCSHQNYRTTLNGATSTNTTSGTRSISATNDYVLRAIILDHVETGKRIGSVKAIRNNVFVMPRSSPCEHGVFCSCIQDKRLAKDALVKSVGNDPK